MWAHACEIESRQKGSNEETHDDEPEPHVFGSCGALLFDDGDWFIAFTMAYWLFGKRLYSEGCRGPVLLCSCRHLCYDFEM